MPRAFVPAHARAPTLDMSIVPRAMTRDFPRIVTDGGVADAPERRARGAMAASCLALAMTLAGVDGEAASAATARGEVLGPVAGTFRENLAREERVVVDEVMRDEQIGIDVIREGATPRERLDMFIEKEPPVAVLFSAMFVVNGCFGLIYTLFIRETSAGPGGEFGKSVVNIRKSIVKGIFTFFNSALGRYTTEDSQDA